MNNIAFVLREEGRSGGVVLDEKVGSYGYHYSQETFLFNISHRSSPNGWISYEDEDPTPAIITANSSHMRNACGKSAAIT